MKKLLVLLTTLVMTLSLVACGGGDDTTKAPENDKQTEAADNYAGKGYALAIDGKNVQIGMSGEDMLALLGEAGSVFEAPSCAGEGIDYTYTYAGGSVEITTVPNAKGINLIDAMVLKDDLISTPEGISLTMGLDDVTAAYGDDYTTLGNAYIYEKDGMQLQFIIENDEITSIQYVVVDYSGRDDLRIHNMTSTAPAGTTPAGALSYLYLSL